ncbi:unnamed protein product [Trypanosoma congolense IL3000]|uniref:adenylate cyclase n=1 Tax=Trypanosoma congolense (strain IL3000) TaxID=1068625 RepID=F9W6C7_TRYCI|nr:unnamed protein product [Trypanosoma congolense IL3000]
MTAYMLSASRTSITGNSVRRSLCRRAVELLATSLLLFLSTGRVDANTTVRVYSLMYHENVPDNFVEAVNAGFNASLASRQWTVAHNMRVKVTAPRTSGTPPIVALENAIKENEGSFFLLLGPMGDFTTNPSFVPTLKSQNLVAFAPLTASTASRGWNPNLYFLRVSATAELLALIRYAIGQLRTLRLGFMYLRNVSFGEEEYSLAVRIMNRMGHEFCCVFTVKSSLTGQGLDDDFRSAWIAFTKRNPQAVILFAPPSKDTEKFVRMVVSDARTNKAFLLAPSILQLVMERMWREALNVVSAPFVSGQVVLVGINPLATDTQYHAIKRFQENVRSYLKSHPGVTVFNSSDDFDHDDIDGQLMVYGWLVGEVLSQALSASEWLSSREAFMESLYDQRRYVVDDLVFGDYGNECVGLAAAHGAMCRCNQGGKVVHVRVLTDGYRLRDADSGMMMFDSSQCYSNRVDVRAPFSAVLFKVTDDPVAMNAAEEMDRGSSLLENIRVGEEGRLFINAITLPSSGIVSGLKSELSKRITDAVLGVVSGSVLDVPGVAFIDPVVLEPRLNKYRRHVIHLSPTLEQQFYVVVSYLADKVREGFHAVIRSSEGDDIGDLLSTTLVTFGMALQSTTIMSGNTSMRDRLPDRGTVYVMGLNTGDAELIADHLERHGSLLVVVPFFDMILRHREFVSAFEGRASADRLLFATNLPHWADRNTRSEFVQQFHKAEKNSSRWTPLTLLGYAASRFAKAVISPMRVVNADALVEAVFAQYMVAVDDMRYGPFDDDNCFLNGASRSKGCAANYGATQISIWSMTRVLNVSAPPLTAPVTPSITYSVPDTSGLTPAHLAGIIVGSIVMLLFFSMATTLLVRCEAMRHIRDNESAPKEPTDPVTLIFTDIESSTALWAAHPNLMPDAVATHHRLIRSTIARHDAYEVKTVGDSFMIACRSVTAAVELARDLQLALLHHDWGTTALDESYRGLEEEFALEVSEYEPPTARLDPAVYGKLWNGLRVRVGIHTGLCDIRHDEVTKGYDYYGQTTNMAARAESVANGGQVLLTSATYYSLSAVERARLDLMPMGPVSLRGVPEPVEMYQLNAVPGRTFAALRLDREVDLINDESDATGSSPSDSSSSTATLCETSQMVARCLESVLGTFAPRRGRSLLVAICERWRVSLPRKPERGGTRTIAKTLYGALR